MHVVFVNQVIIINVICGLFIGGVALFGIQYQHLSDLFVQDAFAFVRALILENHTNIFLNLNNLKRAKEAPIKLVGLIAWQYRQVLSASELLEKRMGEQAVKQKLALFGKSADAVISAAKKHKKTYWGQKLAKLCDLDYKLKSSNTDPWLWLEQFVLEA